MKIKIEFFKEQFIEAIDAGVYEVIVSDGKKETTLYIGESVHVLVRSAIHLYRLKMNPSYFGFTHETINEENLKLIFRLIKNAQEKSSRKAIELEYIKIKKPITQNESNDGQLTEDKRIEAVDKFIKNLNHERVD